MAPELTATATPSGPPSLRRWPVPLVVLAAAVALLVGATVALASHYADQYFLFSPGTAPVITTSDLCRPSQGELALPDGTPCVHLVVPKAKAHPIEGRLLMVDVELSSAGPWDWLEYQLGLLGNQRQLVPVQAYAGPTPPSELACQDSQEMVSADQDAAIAALQTLHYQVKEVPLGAEVEGVFAGTPAWDAGVKCNDLITALDGHDVDDALALTELLQPMQPGTEVTLTDHPASGGKAKLVRVRLTKPPASVVAEGFSNRAYLGVSVATKVRAEMPFAVSVDAGDIGGPSAGLAFTLAILDALSNGKLTGGHVVAATGTISVTGQVGAVGGVQEKTAAVEKAGAQVFFVPESDYRVAEAVASGKLRVVPVATLQQVVNTLEKSYGGTFSAPGEGPAD